MRFARQQLPDKHKQVLLVDSNQQNFEILNPILASNPQYKVRVCRDHAEAMLLLHSMTVDFILISCCSSPLPCPTIISDFYQSYPDIPIIALSQHISEDQGRKLLEANATDYISVESVTPELLFRTLRHAHQTSEKNAEIKLLKQSDPSTAVGNRQFFYLTLLHKLKYLDSHQSLALILLDMDEYRHFTTRYGISTGDLVVNEMARRLKNIVGEQDALARMGNDEFALICTLQSDRDTTEQVRERLNQLVQILTPSFDHGEDRSQLHCSIGAIIAPEHGSDIDQLTRKATVARQHAKQIHGASYAIYRQNMEQTPEERPELATQMMTALRAEQFELFYQPRIELSSGRIVGAEALIRWRHPEHGLIMPGEFIPISERNGLIVAIGYWVIHQAAIHLRQLRQEGLSIDRLGVNLSFRQFKDEMLVDTIKRLIKQEQVNTRELEFELTESAIFSDEEHVRHCLDSLAEEGITFSLDDFGTGYSSFALLHKLPISALKIDRSFVSQVMESPEAAEIVRSIISLAQNMKIKVIAEGVETREQLEFLIDHECDEIQGYFFSPPISFDEFKRMLPQSGQHTDALS